MTLIYFVRPIGQDGPVKIGCSANTAHRLCSLMTWSPLPLEIVTTIPGDLKLERRIHGVFGDLHSHREWFHASPRLTDFIAALAAGSPIGDLIDLSAPISRFRIPQKRNFTEDRRLYLSYSARVRNAFAYARLGSKCAPADIYHILSQWEGQRSTPTAAELARLGEVLASPEQHAITREQRWPKARAA